MDDDDAIFYGECSKHPIDLTLPIRESWAMAPIGTRNMDVSAMA
jgi:hypothetical protein